MIGEDVDGGDCRSPGRKQHLLDPPLRPGVILTSSRLWCCLCFEAVVVETTLAAAAAAAAAATVEEASALRFLFSARGRWGSAPATRSASEGRLKGGGGRKRDLSLKRGIGADGVLLPPPPLPPPPCSTRARLFPLLLWSSVREVRLMFYSSFVQ